MINILAKPLELIGGLFGLAFPMFRGGRPSQADAASSIGAWMARGVLLAVVLAGLALLNQAELIGLKRVIPHSRIREFWLPLFAFCLYAALWLGWWLYSLVRVPVAPVTSEFRDIDRAWSQAVEALIGAGIHLDETPLFLVLAPAATSDAALFHAAGLRAPVKQVPNDPAEPLHVTANSDGIWVTCPGVSLLGQQDPSQAEEDEARLSSLTGLTTRAKPAGRDKTIGIEDFDQDKLHQLFQQAGQRPAHGPQHPKKNAISTKRSSARLRHLCHLIARDRQGLCPINGVLVRVPILAAERTDNADEFTSACRTDLIETFGVFQIRCPVWVLISDLEKLVGFTEFRERLKSNVVNERMGKGWDLVPHDIDDPDKQPLKPINPEEIPTRIATSVEWSVNALFPSMVHSMFEVEVPEGLDASEVLQANARLFRFLFGLYQRRDRLARVARLVKDCIPQLPGQPVLFGGCYFAATGADFATQQAFVPKVLTKIVQNQDNVTWTSDALDQDARFLQWAGRFKLLFSCVIGLGVLAILFLIGWRVFFRSVDQPPADAANTAVGRPTITRTDGPASGRVPSSQELTHGRIRSRSRWTVSPDETVTSLVSRRLVASLKQ